MVHVIPKADWVLFKTEVVKTKTGIVLPDNSQMAADLTKNIVVSVGDKVTRVKRGEEIVVFPKSAIALDFPERSIGKDMKLVKEEFILAVLKEK